MLGYAVLFQLDGVGAADEAAVEVAVAVADGSIEDEAAESLESL